jgi:cell division septum initiation protein DivIVA
MTTMETSQQGQKGELKLNLHLEQPVNAAGSETKTSSKSTSTTSEEKTESKSDEPAQAFKQILSSLKDTQKYLPEQFNTFIESMEGKSIDDLKSDAMHLANKAQEEAKKRTSEVADYGKASLESARSKAQDVMNKAQEQTSNLTGNLSEMVQTPLKATAEKTSGLANRGVEAAQTTIAPYASMAKEYLPEPAKDFVDKNISNKSLQELRQDAIVATRKNLLGVTDTSKAPSLRDLANEIRGALWSGKLLKNSIGMTESAVEAVVGPLPPGTPKDAGNLTRVYNLSKFLTSTAFDYGRLKAGEVTQGTKNKVNQRVQQAKETVTPVMSSLPIVGRYWGKDMSEMKQMAKDKASDLSQQATNMGQQATQKASDMAANAQQRASDAVQQGKQMAGNAMEQGKQMASNATEQGKQMASNVAEKGSQMAPQSAGLNMGKEKMGPTSGANTSSSTTTHGASGSTPAVQVNVNTSGTESSQGLKSYPQGGMPSVSLGGTTVSEHQSTSTESGSKKKGKQ